VNRLYLAGLLAGSFLFVACRSDTTNLADTGTGSPPDSGTVPDTGPAMNPDSGTTMTMPTKLSVRDAFAMFSAGTAPKNVTVENVVVVAENHYVDMSTGTTVGTFYLMDKETSGPGLAAYHSKNDMTAYPQVGDLVTVNGWLSKFDGSLQLSTKSGVTLSVTKNGSGTVTGGAETPAGMPIAAASPAAYSHAMADNHPDQIGNVLKFSGALTVSNMAAFFTTQAMDAGATPRGFEITGGLWVDDQFVYHDCIKPLNLDGGVLPLQNGIVGVWDRYIDYYMTTPPGTGPAVPVLRPTTCKDLGM
jgi:hypothetical protein